ncbi:DUF4838 domain-containing protein [uncultured Tyzzerella sp.]|uniref:DUF4838 domain-containing protein n=1 Tax=uncultured Tyzzerella sp. TaxID=2321398 RepID=UPI0029436CEC|nr:DUF4838 domain-containing protein [uncultured Tyzzerella sp.]
MYNIFITTEEDTIKYASREIAKYLTLVTKDDRWQIIKKKKYSKDLQGIWLCNYKEVGVKFDVLDFKQDDAIEINIEKGNGYITGSNNRSILIGVYKFLEKLGCKFLRPGKDGEKIIHKSFEELSVFTKEKASLRHRGVVIEGANTYENVLDLINWFPKVGYNSYFMQFKYGYTFFKQWYAHINNPYKDKEFFDNEMAIEFTENLAKEIKKRDLLYHVVGHGWTCETVGIVGKGWDSETSDLKEDKKDFLALINGERKFFGDVPLNTNLCNSYKDVQQAFANTIVEYIKENKYGDVIHIWLADAFNNHCECEKCKELTPSDWYVECLNVIDEKLTEMGFTNKIAFLLYFELLWPPIKARFKNPDRFLLMFAPITRTFTKAYDECKKIKGSVNEFKLNKIKLPTKVEDYIEYLKEWQKIFKGDSFDFDYHLGKAHYGDAGYYEISEIISKDIKNLKDLGLNGLLSCQEQRAFFPTALPNYVMAKTLWDTSLEFENLAKEYFENAFGEDYEKCQSYLKEISDIFDTDYWHLRAGQLDEKVAKDLQNVHTIVENFRKICEKNQNHIDKTENLSWKYINYHLDYVIYFADALRLKAGGNDEEANKHWEKFRDFICKNEDDLQRALDVFRVLMIGKNNMGFKLNN